MVIQKVSQARLDILDELDETDRNHDGFGSTGTR
jgi:dUTPase